MVKCGSGSQIPIEIVVSTLDALWRQFMKIIFFQEV